ncbi:hypothetical protein IGI04_037610 [Brassica rapa subsp. trilocularis]|uniref:Uncharacterized protein n=1 Tax=Brassica rapa subsp. trilocularis TaxID=1813537 RepID=A0ABQ7LKK3_BRACM|nr:hypothetical protein IGI04_037610 [Brassica rapa subsp. trilocularis]
MVLSNKKLKQKLRQDLVKSLSVSVAETNPESVSSLQSQSLKSLLDSASHKPRLTKREIRRKVVTSTRGDEPNEVEGDAEKTDEKNTKKRKREDTVKVELAKGEEEGVKEGEESQKKKTKKKKKQKKKKRKTNKTPKKADEDKVEEKVKTEEIQVETESKEEEDGIVPKKIYVGGIPYQSTEDEIRSYFRSCGVITKVDCKMRPEDGAFTGIAFITFETEDGANRALAFDRAAMGDRYLTIQQYVKTTPSVPRTRTSSGFVPEMVEGYHRVYIGNLAWDTTEREIRKLFSDCVINTVRLGKNKETGDFKGYAHVDFKDSVSVAMALKLDQQVMCGRPVKICCALKERPVEDHSTNPTPGETNMEETDAAADEVNYFENTMSSGKIKRRSCYECGEKGHLSTACPKKLQETVNARPQAMPSYDLQRSYGGSYMDETYTATNEAYSEGLASEVSTGKVKRRTCYECGEKGHLSTACPKKLQDAHKETVNARPAMFSYDYHEKNNGGGGGSYMNETYAAANEAPSGSLPSEVSVGKIKRRSCYECGEKGHLSTACPSKLQNSGHSNSKADHQTVEARPVQVTSYNSQKESGDTDNKGGSYMDVTHAADPISVAATNGTNEGGSASKVSAGKMKRRICHECGLKGHLSSACPKKQQK